MWNPLSIFVSSLSKLRKVFWITDMEYDMFKEKLTNTKSIPHFFQNSIKLKCHAFNYTVYVSKFQKKNLF
jgi:hypothetical protein